jgi:hypothetical protein
MTKNYNMPTKTKIITAMAIMAISSVFIIELSSPAGANATGAPSSMTGSPGDGNNCTSCHSGTATTQAGLITSNIPMTGYVPGQTYTITGSVTESGRTKFGFQISPQNTSGSLKGTMTVTNSTSTQLTNSGKYITHKFGGTNFISGTASWSFDWTAPSAGSGAVTFYGSFNSTNSNSNTSGDLITLSTLTVSEDITTGIADVTRTSDDFSVYPNPFTDRLYIKNTVNGNAATAVSVMDVYGKEVKKLKGLNSDGSVDLQELSNGYYMVRIESEEGVTIKKVAKR